MRFEYTRSGWYKRMPLPEQIGAVNFDRNVWWYWQNESWFQKTSHSEYFLKFFQSLFFDFRSSDCITHCHKDSVDMLNEEFLGHRNVILPCFWSKRYLKAVFLHLYDLCQKWAWKESPVLIKHKTFNWTLCVIIRQLMHFCCISPDVTP